MDISLILAFAFTFLLSAVWFPVLIRLAVRRLWVDIPTSRRRHTRTTPVVGGVGIFAAWLVGVSVYSWLNPAWFFAQQSSVLVLTLAIFSLMTIGLLDDLRGLSPFSKLAAEFLLAAFVLKFEPHAHNACRDVIATAPGLLQPALWGLAAVWIVGTTNAVNLVDGIDGFAGGVSLLAIMTLLVLHSFAAGANQFMPVALTLVVPGLVMFLFHNWHPAKIFLGDNGSLTLGFLIAVGGLIPAEPQHAFTTAGSLLILLAYPILDMGLCVARRFRNGYPIFKADRSHLHHRTQRLGLTVPQTSILLLFAVSFFQVSALLVHLVHPRLAILVAASAVLGLFCLLYLIQCLESWQRENLLSRALPEDGDEIPLGAHSEDFASMIQIDLRPLLEVGLWEEKNRAEFLLGHLFSSLRRSIRKDDRMVVTEQKVKIYLTGGEGTWNNQHEVKERVRRSLGDFQLSFQLQYSLDGLPLESKEVRGVA